MCSSFLPKNQVFRYTASTLEAPKVLYFADQTQYFHCIAPKLASEKTLEKHTKHTGKNEA